MRSRWTDSDYDGPPGDLLALRVHTSRLLGNDPSLVLHGGGNTSVKLIETDFFGDAIEILRVKGSGWDLATIAAAGFSPVRMDALLRMAERESMTDTEMVTVQRTALLDPYAPNPSVEAILHAIIPFRFVDHTHADAVVTLTNSPAGEAGIRELYGDDMLVVPYVMPGFVLARRVWEMTRGFDWQRCQGIILMNHGVFTFSDDARESYENMISIVDRAERRLDSVHAAISDAPVAGESADLVALARLRREVSRQRGSAMIALLDESPEARAFAAMPDVASIATRGPLTPDHVIRTKRTPLILDADPATATVSYADAYRAYYERNHVPGQTCLDPAPRWAVWPGAGTVAFGDDVAGARIVADIIAHTRSAIREAEALGGWVALPEKDIYEVEYWDLEQAKLRTGGTAPEFRGRIAIVTGAARGIGRACTEALVRRGAMVVALDIDDTELRKHVRPGVMPVPCDVTDPAAVRDAVERAVRTFGGLDIVVSNAGNFPADHLIESMPADVWQRSLDLNLNSHEYLLQAAIPFLREGIEPAVVIIASKNVPAPGPGAAAYSVAKAGTTQLARVAALELGAAGIRVNVLHPNAVFDTGLWSDDVLEGRAKRYGLSVDEYRRDNVLRTEVRSADVAEAACALAGPGFARTTGAQIPVDGGNVRVI